MGMDGLSMANTGAIKEQTSAEYSSRVEQAIVSDPTNSSQQVQSAANNQRVREKEDDESNSKNTPENDVFEDGFVKNEEEDEEEDVQDLEIEDIENPEKDFYVKLNIKDDIIELYDSSTDRLVETISGIELGSLVQKLNMASGIFINKKV